MNRRALAIGLLLASTPLLAYALSVAITAIVEERVPPTPPDTVVIFRGIAYPNSQVSIRRNGELQVSVPADPAARFDVSLGQQPAGTSTYSLSSDDAAGRSGNAMDFTLTIVQGSTVTLTGIFLGPTIEADKTSMAFDETVIFLGVTAPSSSVTIFVASDEPKSFKTDADASGLWTKQLLGSDLGAGDHTARAKAVAPTAEVSDFSKTVSLHVGAAAPQPCDGKNRSDINCDGKVNLTDFSIMLFYWKQRDPANSRTDLNRDGIVNLTDLSILLFNWSR